MRWRDIGVKIEGGYDGHVRPPRGQSHLMQDLSLAIVVDFGDHRAMQRQEHTIQRSRGHGRVADRDRVKMREALDGLAGDDARGRGPDGKDRDQVEPVLSAPVMNPPNSVLVLRG